MNYYIAKAQRSFLAQVLISDRVRDPGSAHSEVPVERVLNPAR
jgi:hypothetical protein